MSFWSLLENELCFFCGDFSANQSGICLHCVNRIKQSIAKKGDLCPVCSQPVFSYSQEECPFCQNLPEAVNRLLSMSYFNGYMKEIVTLFKAGKSPSLRFFIADLINDLLEKENLSDALIVPIPPRKWKIHNTGWDQIELLCRTLNGRYGKNIFRCLKRTDQLQQKTLKFRDRKEHMKASLQVNKYCKRIDPSVPVVLLDDVWTSGATLGAAAELLKDVGSTRIPALVLSIVI